MKKALSVILTLCLLVGLSGCCLSGDLFSDAFVDWDELYISAAKNIVADNLKNPSSAVYNDAYVYEKDDYGRAIVYLDVSAQNGYGGYTRDDWWVCITNMDADGNYTYNRYASHSNKIANLSLLKSLNDFGEPKEE